MGVPLRAVLLSVPAILAVLILTLHGANARRYGYYYHHPRDTVR